MILNVFFGRHISFYYTWKKQLLLLKYKYLQSCLPVLLNSFYTCLRQITDFAQIKTKSKNLLDTL